MTRQLTFTLNYGLKKRRYIRFCPLLSLFSLPTFMNELRAVICKALNLCAFSREREMKSVRDIFYVIE